MRLYLLVLRRDRNMVGRQEIAADDAMSARLIGAAIFKSCGEDCDSYELWEDAYRIDARFPINADRLNEQLQAHVIATEEAILRGKWPIARSNSLRTRLNALKAARP